MEMTIMSVLLLAVLFIAGLVNIFIYFPSCNKFHAWIRSLLFTKPDTPRAINSDGFAAKPPKASSAVQSEKKTEQLKRIFAGFDKNGDGSITKEEIQDSLQNLGLLATEKEVEEMVAKVDSNGDGLIDFDEFCMLYQEVVGGKTKHDEDKNYGDDDDDEDGVLREAFEVFDKDKDGLISVEELRSVLSSLGLNEGKKMENCREMIKKVDKDGDGMVDFSEFKKMMKVGGILV